MKSISSDFNSRTYGDFNNTPNIPERIEQMLSTTTVNNNHEELSIETEYKNNPMDWIKYLRQTANCTKDLSSTELQRYELAKFMDNQMKSNRHLFHMTITYKEFNDIPYSPKIVNNFFTNFYAREFLPYLVQERRIEKKIPIQPICYSFLDEHEHTPVVGRFHKIAGTNDVTPIWHPVRLHHHAILAVHPDTLERMESLLGENTLVKTHTGTEFTHKILTTDLKACMPMRLLYASKKFYHYPDFLMFPPRTTNIKKSSCGRKSSIYGSKRFHR